MSYTMLKQPGAYQTAPAVRAATTADVPRLAAALADAFIDDPLYRWMVPQSVRLTGRLKAMFSAELEQNGLARGMVWTTAGCDGAVIALPPGAWEMPMSMTGREALLWTRALGRRLALAGRVQRVMERHHPQEPHTHVRVVGVRTALQGRGLGTALLHRALQEAEGLAAYIEASTTRSAALYERLGFERLGVLELPEGGPPLWPMLRPPVRLRP